MDLLEIRIDEEHSSEKAFAQFMAKVLRVLRPNNMGAPAFNCNVLHTHKDSKIL